MKGKIIEIRNAALGYGDKKILPSISLDVEEGGIYCVFGRNGSGKSTLLKSISGLIEQLDGNIMIKGRNLLSMTNSERSKIMSVVLTNRPMISNITVEAFVSFGRYPYSDFLGKLNREDVEICEKAIERTGIDELKDKWLSELSDGEMQKVQIARALAQNTPLLLLDEPASHLDLVNKGEIFKLLSDIATEGDKTVLFTSHDIQFALQLADHFIVINEGKVEIMTCNEFRHNKIYEKILKSDVVEIDPSGHSLKYKRTTS